MENPAQIFRREAVEHQGAGTQEGGAVLRLAPSWTAWAFWLLLAVVGFYGAFALVGRVSEYASGPAVVRLGAPGEPVEILATLPGHFRPLLQTGAVMRLELQGFPFQYQELPIERLEDTLVEPREVREQWGPGLAERLSAGVPVVVVRARVPSREFDAGGQRLAYFHGMQGTVSVRVKSERIVTTLVPGLKLFFP